MHAFDRQTEFLSLDHVCIPCSTVKTQGGRVPLQCTPPQFDLPANLLINCIIDFLVVWCSG